MFIDCIKTKVIDRIKLLGIKKFFQRAAFYKKLLKYIFQYHAYDKQINTFKRMKYEKSYEIKKMV